MNLLKRDNLDGLDCNCKYLWRDDLRKKDIELYERILREI